jgi:arylsulfatase A-like enzyme
MDNHWNVPVTDRHADGEYPVLASLPQDSGTGEVWPDSQIADRHASGIHSSDLFASAVIDFVRDAADGDEPFFAYMAAMEPHDPRTPPGEYLARYDHRDIDVPENFAREHPFDNGELDVHDEHLATHPRDPAEIRRHVADYYASVTHLDHHIGRVLNALEETGERDTTIVAVTADHGLAVGQHGLLGKQNLYDHSVRVPLVLAGPDLPAGERRDTLCYQSDLYPTLCELADLPIPSDIATESLVPAIRDSGATHRDAVVGAYKNCQRMLREERYKLISYEVDGERTTQLFDLDADPEETENLANDPDHADRLDRMRTTLVERCERLDDPNADAIVESG